MVSRSKKLNRLITKIELDDEEDHSLESRIFIWGCYYKNRQGERAMKKLVLTVPTLYGDHHASAIRDILENTKGVAQFYISSAYHQIELEYDPKKVKEAAIKKALADQGYEADEHALAFIAGQTSVGDRSTRHTGAFTGIGDTLSFSAKQVSFEGRPLWPCPGFSTPAEMDK